jgi:hypothetical protein
VESKALLLGIRKLIALIENVNRHRRVTEVVHQSRSPQLDQVGVVQTQALADTERGACATSLE